ncbi:MAG: DUF488 domain-containing protein [Acidobacteriaceae bacterium]
MDIHLKRTNEPAERGDGVRLLVDRLWPRGIRKDALKLDAWLKEVAPSTELRKWFAHDPAKWDEFQRRYFAEVDARPEVLEPLLAAVRQGPVTLLYSAHDTEHNQAVALSRYLANLNKRKKR